MNDRTGLSNYLLHVFRLLTMYTFVVSPKSVTCPTLPCLKRCNVTGKKYYEHHYLPGCDTVKSVPWRLEEMHSVPPLSGSKRKPASIAYTIFLPDHTALHHKTWLTLFGTRYVTSAPTTHRKLHLYCWNVCTNHCTVTVAVLINLLSSNEWGVTQQRAINTRTSKAQFYCCVPFEVSMASTVTAWGKHVTLLSIFREQTASYCTVALIYHFRLKCNFICTLLLFATRFDHTRPSTGNFLLAKITAVQRAGSLDIDSHGS
jgi:hypothetical protein